MDIQAPARTMQPAFHADDLDPAIEYGSLSSLAVIGFVLGLASPLCFIGLLLMIVPVLGIAVSVTALRQINSSGGALAGRWLAAMGLALSVGSIASYVTRDVLLDHLRSSQAAAFGKDWIELVKTGKLDDAFRLTTDGAVPRPSNPEPGAPAPTQTPFQKFSEQPVIKALVALGPKADVALARTISVTHLTTFSQVQQQFAVTPQGAEGAAPVNVILDLRRVKLTTELGSRWLVGTFDDAANPTIPANIGG